MARVPLSAFLSTPLVLRLQAGPSQSIGGRLFRKEIARVGEWEHPGTGQLVSFSRDDLTGIADRTNKYAQAIGGIRFPNKHDGFWVDGAQPNAEDNLGRWLSFSVDGDKLYGVVEAADDKVAEMLGGRIRSVSLCLVPEAKDSHGNVFKGVLDHVAATPEAVLDNQENFVALARNGTPGTPVPVLRLAHKEDRMTLSPCMKRIAESLAMDITSPDADSDDAIAELVVSKIKTMTAQTATMSKSAGEATALAARVTALEAAKTKAESDVTALSKDIAAREAADCDREVAEVVALASASGKPESFDAESQAFVRERWAKDRPAAKRELGRARALAVAITPRGAGTTTTRPPDKVEAAEKAKNDLDAKIALARGAGHRIEKEGDHTYAVTAEGKKIRL